MSRRFLLLVPCVLTLLLGCGGDVEERAEVAAEAPAPAAESASVDNPVTSSNNILLTPHAEGRFLADWPVGTGRLRTRTVDSNTGAVDHAIVRVDCTREGDILRGCSVTVWFELPGGRVPGPDDVTLRLGNIIREHGLEILRQFPIQRDGMEGITTLCKHPKENRYAWMEGFVSRGRVLVVTAWDRDEGLFSDPQVRKFLSSVIFNDH